MQKKNEANEGLQSRREFFKKVSNAALPILGAILLSSTPLLHASSQLPRTDCYNGCTSTCEGSCKGACKGCSAGCSSTCMSGCVGGNKSTR